MRYFGTGMYMPSQEDFDFVERISMTLKGLRWHCTTTHHGGLDQAFANGAMVPDVADPQLTYISMSDHGDYITKKLTDYTQNKMGQQFKDEGWSASLILMVMALLGPNLDEPCDMALYILRERADSAAYPTFARRVTFMKKICDEHNIPHFNLLTQFEEMEDFISSKMENPDG